MRSRVSFIPQMEAVECGAASLAMVLAFHGHHAPLSEVRQRCGISRDGSTVKNIAAAASTYGLEPVPVQLEPETLAKLEDPAILHWDMNHFVVFEHWTPKGVWIVDPADGRRFVPTESFDESFTGIAVLFDFTDDFEERPREKVSAARYLALLRGAGSALAMVLFASLVIDVLATVTPLTTQVAIDHVIGRHRVDWLFVVGASALALVTFSALWSLLRGSLLVRIRARLDVAITQQFVGHLLSLPVAFFGQRTVADLMARVQANRTIREMLAGESVGLLADGVMLLAYLALMFAFDASLSWIVLVAGIVYVGIFLVGRPLIRAGADDIQRAEILAGSALLQILRGITTIKSAGIEHTSRMRWLNAWIASLNANAKNAMTQQTVQTGLFAVRIVVPLVVLFVGGRRVLDGDLTPGRLVAFQMLQAGFLLPLQGVIRALLRLQMIPVLLARMDDVLLSDKEAARTAKCPRLEGGIELRNVTFAYSPTSPPVLDDISFRIEPRQKVAFVGASGSGKSTIARLLLGLYAPNEGEVLLDGHDLATLDLTSVRRQYGVVLQETALFDGTIADNLRLFHPTAPQEHLVQAARVAQIHDDILALPRGYETRISSSAGVLSGGQRQRLVLARAIVHRPPIMILDEATSALDAVTEGAIERYLSTRACTRVVIAHRLTTVRDADMIFVVDQGKIVEQGRHAELVAAEGLYARLVAVEQEPRAESVSPSERQAIVVDELAPFEVVRGWTVEQKVELVEELQRADFPEGTRVVEQDDRAAGLYLIVEGTVAIELAEPGLAAWTVAELGPGSIFGEAGLLDGSPSSASVVSRTPVRLLHLPYGAFQEMLRRGDVLGARAMLSLGAIVAERMRDAVRRRDAMCADNERRSDAEKAAGPSGVSRRELPIGETLLGAALDADEIESLERIASRVVIGQDEALFASGTEADTLFVVRSGSVALQSEVGGTLSVVDAGAILAETTAFDGGPHVLSAVARGEVVATAIHREELVELLLSGQRVAKKLLAPLAETLARRFRLANYGLREAVALSRGELERAHAAREQALLAAREEREALDASGEGLPVVLVKAPEQTSAACLTALLRAAGRPTSMPAVIEAFVASGDRGAGTTRGLLEVSRSFGLECRKLEVPLRQLRALEAPIVGYFEDERAVVLEGYGAGGFRVMDPLRGRLVVGEEELAKTFGGTAFEVRDPWRVPVAATLPQRVALFAQWRLPDLVRLAVVTLVVQAAVMGTSLATALAVQRVFPLADRPLLGVIVVAAAALGVGHTVMQQLQGRAIEHLRAHLDRELLDQLMDHILKLPIAFFDRFPPGEVLQRFQAFANVRQLFSTQGVAVLLGVASLVVAAVLLVAFAPQMFFVVGLVGLLYTVVTASLFPALRRIASDEIAARARQQDRLIEILQGVTTLRVAGDASVAEQRWLPSFLDELSASLRRDRAFAVMVPLFDWARGLAVVLCVWLGTKNILEGALSLGALVGFLAVFAAFLEAVNGLAIQILSSAPSLVDYGLVRATFAEPLEQASGALLAPGQLRGRIALDQVSFRYTEGGPLVLRDVSLQVESGMKVALVGASGSGKSTLGRLLLGLYLPSAGRILFDGKDVSSLDLEALRRRIGVVLQEPFVLPGTIRENIALGAEGATLERVADAAERAAIAQDIDAMPMGYETIVAEGGASFSGGQRQRLVIARALVSSPAILLLDEATSALDNLSQAVIERHLARSTATRIVIAHRLSTIVDADLIVVVHKGSVVEQGTHHELLAKRGRYYELVHAQVGGEEGT